MTAYLHSRVINVDAPPAGPGNAFPVPVKVVLGRPSERVGTSCGLQGTDDTAGVFAARVAVCSIPKRGSVEEFPDVSLVSRVGPSVVRWLLEGENRFVLRVRDGV